MTRAQITILSLAGFLVLFLLGGITWFVIGRNDIPMTVQPTILPTVEVEPGPTAAPDIIPTDVMAVEGTQVLASPIPTAFDPLACLPMGGGEVGHVVEILPDVSLRADLGTQIVEIKLLGADYAGTGGQALGLLRELVEGKKVRLLRGSEDTDAAGRLLRYVVVDGVFVNYELVRRGAALPALFPPGQVCTDTILAAEQLARSQGSGYWSLRANVDPSIRAAATPTGLPCDCSKVYQCTDFTSLNDAQACYNACGDYRNVSLDADKDGLACEELP